MTTLDDRNRGPDERPVGSLTGLTPDAAREFHGLFMMSFIIFTVIAIVAHVLVWFWRPWLSASAEITGAVQLASAVVAPAFG